MSDEYADWYYVTLDSQQGGPVKKADLKPLFAKGSLNENTQVWCDGMADWATIASVAGLVQYLKPAAVPPAGPTADRPPNPFGGGGGPLGKLDFGSVQLKKAAPTPEPSPKAASVVGAGGLKLDLGSVQLKKAAATPQPSPSPRASPADQQGGLFAAIAQRKAKMEQNPDLDPDRMKGQLATEVLQEEKKIETVAVPAPPKKQVVSAQTDWQELLSPEGTPYYYNKVTKVTQWDKPDELKTEAEKDKAGNWLWMPDPQFGFVPARELEGYNDQFYHLQCEDGTQNHSIKKTVQLDRCLWHVFRSVKHVSDLVLLDDMSMALILHTLQSRFQVNNIYTNVGTILISINPYKRLPLYTPDIIDAYNRRGNKWVPPHVYLVASEAYNQLLETKFPQSISISGESGAGKTECTKQALQFLAEVAGSSTSNVEQKILASNPILEAFGNAKTVRNNNSSRFGKYVEVLFDHSMTISGSTNTNYLLEKVRVVKPNKGERNYHAFYQLIRGSDNEAKRKFQLKEVKDYTILTISGCDTVEDMDDAHEYREVLKAYEELGWSQADQDNVNTTLAAVLHIGNIQFRETGDRKCQVISQEPIEACCSLLKMDKALFTKAVTVRVMRVTGQADIDVSLGKDEAEHARDALAKFIYEKMFDWIVQRINTSIGRGQPASGPRGVTSIGILDIFGFEIFEHNQFEQLCINFTNEKLQQFFNQHTFKKEEEVYRFEGINFDKVSFIDNQPMLDLIELKPTGILPLVDEEIRMPKGSDKTFVSKLCQQQKSNKYFKSYLKNPELFVVEHYAGSVIYDSNGFLEKNRDRLNDDAYKAILTSQFPFLVQLFNESSSASRATLGTKFAGQLNALMTALNQTEPHYIRCVKPNPNKAQLQFHPAMVLEQLRYSGVFEAVTIRKMGFPFRYTHLDFWKRFKCILPPTTQWSNDQVANCKRLITEMKKDTSLVQVGKTRILYRATEHRDMELIRNYAVDGITSKIQQKARGWHARRIQAKCLAARPKLQQAINTRTIEALQAAIAAVGNVGFELYELTQARRLIFVIEEEKRLEKLMTELLQRDPESVFELLQRAVSEADDIQLKSDIAQRARTTLKELEDRKQARAWLKEGVEEAEQEKCEWAVATAKRLRMPDSTTAAEQMIERCKKETVLVAAMSTAMQSGGYINDGDNLNPGPLRSAVDAATAFQCKTKEGKLVYKDAFVLAKIRDTLRAALGTKDRALWRACGDAIAFAVDDSIKNHPEVNKAADEVAHQAAVDEICDMLTQGVQELDQEILTFNLGQAERLRIDEVKYPIVPSAREYLGKIIEAKRLMEAAVQAVDEVQLMYAVQYAEAFNYEKPQTVSTRQLRDFVMKVSTDAEYALEIMEEQPMRDVVARAAQVKYVTPQIQELQRWLASSEEKFVQQQLKCANKLKDEPRVIRLTIKLKDLFINRQPEQFELSRYGRLRTATDWADMKLISMNREKLAASFRNHTLDTIHTSLTELDTINPKAGDNAKKIFKNILGIMGDKKYGEVNALMMDTLRQCQEEPALRDETLCQLMKQLTNNPNNASEQKGWSFLHVFLEQFAPKEVENFLIVWIRKNAKGGSADKYLRSLHLSSFFGGRPAMLTDLEINRIMSTGQSLRDTDYTVERPYQSPDPLIPPPGYAVKYYQDWVLRNQEKAQQKEAELRAQHQRNLEMGGSAVAAKVQAEKQEEYIAPPPPAAAAPAPNMEAPLPPGWFVAYADGDTYYYDTTGRTTWTRPS